MERFQNNIQKWVELDNKVKNLNEEIRAYRNQKNEETNFTGGVHTLLLISNILLLI